MKKIVFVVISLCFSCIVFATTFTKSQNYDVFGDLIKGSSTIISKSLTCTYTTTFEKNEKAEFTVQIADNGIVSLIITSEKWVGIPGGEQKTDRFTVIIRPDIGEDIVINSVGLSQDDNKRYTTLKLGNIVSRIARCQSVRIIVKNDNVTINLGTIDTYEIESLFYEKTEYDYICKLINEGKHQDAIQRIEKLENQAKESYVYFGLSDIKKGIHTIDEGRVINEPTCTEEGLLVFSCPVCGEIMKSEILPAIGHRYDPYRCGKCGEDLSVGSIGPAGGYIFYDCDADNDYGNDDGLISSECGWRFLEAAPNDYSHWGIEMDVSGSEVTGYYSQTYKFGYYRDSMYGQNKFVNGTTIYDESNCTGIQVGTGKTNTQLLVSAMGRDKAYSNESPAEGGGLLDSAAMLCVEIEYWVNEELYNDWFLPSWYELDYMYDVLKMKGLGGFRDYYYMSSSEHFGGDDSFNEEIGIDFEDGESYAIPRGINVCMRPIRSF